uniref:Uncharacterized protein n=1 Tax=Rhizophora mucronata TaxID=61149 RepID=A0A2P2QIU4_RHIMU
MYVQSSCHITSLFYLPTLSQNFSANCLLITGTLYDLA